MKTETGTFFSHIPYARVGTQPRPILVLSGRQAFVQRPIPARVSRDAARIARILPPGRKLHSARLRAIGERELPAGNDRRRVTARTLIVGGTADQLFGHGMQQQTAALAPNATLISCMPTDRAP